MRRFYLIALIIPLLLACGGLFSSKKGGSGTSSDGGSKSSYSGIPTSGSLDQDARVAWEKLRNRQEHLKHSYAVAVLKRGDRSDYWGFFATDLERQRIERITDDQFDADTCPIAVEHAIGLARDPTHKICAIVNLFGDQDPVIWAWAFDNGKKISVSADPQKKEHLQSARTFLESVQQKAKLYRTYLAFKDDSFQTDWKLTQQQHKNHLADLEKRMAGIANDAQIDATVQKWLSEYERGYLERAKAALNR